MKKILSAVTILLIILQFLRCTEVYSLTDTLSGYEYSIINNEATITGFKGEPEYINIPETIEGCRVTEIRDNAFYECSTLKHIDIPTTVTKIGHHAFYACTSLENVMIPESVTDIGMGCFCGCTAISSVTFSEGLTSLPESCFRACTSLKAVNIPDSVTYIGDFCFSGCTSLSSVSLGQGISSVGDCAFYMCSSMKSLFIPSSVKTVGICAVGYEPTEEGAQTAEGFTLLGDGDSAAKDYAKENHLTYTDASDSVHAFAIQHISGRRTPVTIHSVILAGAFIFSIFLVIILKKCRKNNIKTKINKISIK